MKNILRETENGILKFTNLTAISSVTVAEYLGVRHYDLMKSIKKAEKYHKSLNDDHRSIDFAPIFKNWKYQDKRNRTLPCKIMNQDGLLALIKVVDTQEAYNYYAVLMSDFKAMKMERHIRQVSKERSHSFSDEVGLLNDRLTAEGSAAGKQRIFKTFNQKINRKATGRRTPRGGVDHDTFTGEEDFHIAKLKSGVAEILAGSHHLTTREARDKAYKFIKDYK